MHICYCLRLISAKHEIQVPDFFPKAWRRSVKDKNTVHGQIVVRLLTSPLPSFLPPGQEGTGVAIYSIMQAGCFWIVVRKRENNETVTSPAGVGQVRARSVLFFFYTFFLFRSGTRERYLLSKTLPIFRV